MARTRKRPKNKKSKKKNQSRFSGTVIKKLAYSFFLLAFLVFSVGILTYVVFFRIVVAAELGNDPAVSFEEGRRQVVIPGSGGEAGRVQVPECAIIIDDMGYNLDIGKKMIDLPLDLSFSFLPHAPFTPELENMANERGRMVLLHLPLQPKDAAWDPGPGALLINETAQQKALFLENLTMVPHADGVNNHMGSLYTEDQSAMNSLLELVEESGLFFIDSYTTPDSLGLTLAQRKGIKSARRQIFLDNIEDVEAICERIAELVHVALQQGQAIGIAHPYENTLIALESCIDANQSMVKFVGVNRLVN